VPYRIRTLATALLLCAIPLAAHAAPPRLERHGSTQQLIVHDRPMLVLGGELGNSSASSPAYLQPHWPRLEAMNLNTVLAPVYWELVEPVEGRFDFSSVDELLREARAHELKLVILWFGAWKNSMSTYVPSWVKRDPARFPRAQRADGSSVEILSVFQPATLEADRRAFAALMEHLGRVDGELNTVLMVQIENEIGMLPIARERGATADRLYAGPVPAELLRALARRGDTLEPELRERWLARGARTSGSWSEVFGDDAWGEEVFTAWHYARFVEQLAVAGKQRYALPMFVNAALNRSGRLPGEYPSGGPLPHLLDVWKAAAPSLDFLAPDIYFPNFAQLAARFRRADNPLFIPEAGNAVDPRAAANAFHAFGALDAFGFSPFSIESLADAPHALSQSYAVLAQLAPLLNANRGQGRTAGFRAEIREDGTVIDAPAETVLGGYAFTVSFVDPWTPREKQSIAEHGGLLIHAGGEDFWVAGQGITLSFSGA
jgi:beta-galactosidase GanA